MQAAFHAIHESGFRGTDLETILRAAGVTKGAMYYHFENKEALGYAVVDEIIASLHERKVVVAFAKCQKSDRYADRYCLVHVVETGRPPLRLPLNNLSQEMSPLDEGFRREQQRFLGTGKMQLQPHYGTEDNARLYAAT